MSKCILVLSLLALSTGCLGKLSNGGVGYIGFKDKGLQPAAAGTDPVTYDVECKDDFKANGKQTGLGNQAGDYSAACTYQGKPMPWAVVGTFSAAPMANTTERWTKYRAKVVVMAKDKHCSAVALRTMWPTKNQEGEAFGAFCVM